MLVLVLRWWWLLVKWCLLNLAPYAKTSELLLYMTSCM
jgi:hypothetical protein